MGQRAAVVAWVAWVASATLARSGPAERSKDNDQRPNGPSSTPSARRMRTDRRKLPGPAPEGSQIPDPRDQQAESSYSAFARINVG